jgi:F-type H+-transporting ATPase subunit alpha
MKKVSGTLKLDQAQFRELEAFSKFGSDLDATTQRTIDRGRRNQEILKQPQFSPSPVEDQVAIIFASTKGYLDKVPENKVKAFEEEFLSVLKTQHQGVLDALRGGKYTDEQTDVLASTAKDIAGRYIKA